MARLHLFNPENDFALALGRRSFTPDKGALAIRRAGQLLPLWWASPGDAILIDSPRAIDEAIRIKHQYGLSGEIVSQAPQSFTPEPWGWSHYTRRLFLAAGAEPDLLPDDDYLDEIRNLAHRRTAIKVNRLLNTPDHLMPLEATDADHALQEIDSRFRGDAVVKLPWSSSGRGVIYAAAIPRPTLETYIRGMIRRQGSVTIEPRYNRIRDFAMLFHSADGKSASYRGLSVFETDSRGFYAGNLVGTQNEIAAAIGVDTSNLVSPLQEALSSIIRPSGYRGWIGVDMLTYRLDDFDSPTLIAPCIEINFRRTMGVAALAAADHITEPALITHSGLQPLPPAHRAY